MTVNKIEIKWTIIIIISDIRNVVFSVESPLVHLYIHKNWDQLFLTDDIYSLDYPIDHWNATIPDQSNVPFVHYQRIFRLVSMLATPYRNHLHRIAEPHEQNDVYRVPSTIRVILELKIVPDDSDLMLLLFGGNLDVGEFPCVSLVEWNQRCPLNVRIYNKHQNHEPTRTFVRALFFH